MSEIETQQFVETRTRKRVRLTGRHLIDLLMGQYGDAIPLNASVTVHVPGGGDWSNTDLDIDAECPIVIQWETVETEGGID